jgi:hypothetical protein
LLTTTFTGLTITCPTGQPNCTGFSNPLLVGNVIWQNRSFQIGITGAGTGTQNQQNLVSLFNANFTGTAGTAAPVQSASGQCGTGVSYWDIGVRGDTGPGNHGSGFTLGPAYSVLDDPGDYPGRGNSGSNPNVVSQSCNGSRVPPTCTVADGCGGPSGYGVPPGIVDASTPNPVFSLTPAATVDEGNNWINVSFGPLALSDDSVAAANGRFGAGSPFGNYVLAAGSPALEYIPCSNTGASQCTTVQIPATGTPIVPSISLPTTDFFGNPRPDSVGTTTGRNCNPNTNGHACVDVGAVESRTFTAPSLISISPTSGVRGTTVPVDLTGLSLSGATAVTVSGNGVTCTITGTPTTDNVTANCVITANAALTARDVTVRTPGGTSTLVAAFTVQGATLELIDPATGTHGTTQPVILTGTNLTGATAVRASGSGVTCTITGTPTTTTVTANCVITSGAALTPRNVTVTTPIGTTNALTFTVN